VCVCVCVGGGGEYLCAILSPGFTQDLFRPVHISVLSAPMSNPMGGCTTYYAHTT
jgi:hypothetical protein